jgi:hypothetical protein
MNPLNARKKAGEYAGEFVIITADENVYSTFMEACRLYETGGLVNPDTNQLYCEDYAGDFYRGPHIVPYTFKPLHGLGLKVVMELAGRITGGLDIDGRPILGRLPKVFLGSKPKSIAGMTAKQWCERKKHKMNIARGLAKKARICIWDMKTKGIYVSIWRQLKIRHGILHAHMDELLRRGGK